MKKLFVIILVFIGILLTSNFTPLGSTTSKAAVANKVSSADILAPPSLFPTNATFETKAEVVGNATMLPIGGSNGSDYYAQSFKALSDYIINGGLWLHSQRGITPNFRLMLCNNTASGWPNVANPMVISEVISGATINAKPGRFYLNLTAPIRVQQNRTYWLVIDGYYDHTTAGVGESLVRNDNPYSDGFFAHSNDNGTSWGRWSSIDADFVVNFSNRPDKAEVFGPSTVASVGGQGTNYYAQSFKALDSYIVDAGIWIEKYVEPTPNFRVQIWGNNASGYPDKNNVIASSRVIRGSEINSTQGGRFFVHPNVSIPVTVGETYWLMIDGYYDHTTAGRGRSRWAPNDPYKDGYFTFSNNAGVSWENAYVDYDLDFIVTFSAQRSAIQVDGNNMVAGIGGTGSVNYLAQSFKALNKYIVDAGVWLENYTNNAPAIRILIVAPKLGGDPNVTNVIAASIPISGAQIISKPGRFYLQPTKPIEVVHGQNYYLVIDGWYDHTTAASIRTRDRMDNSYTDGRDEAASFNAGTSWTYYISKDLDMDIRFSDIPYEAQCGSTNWAYQVGWTAVTPYFAQSFVALNDYIADAGIWLAPWSGTTPDFRLLLCGNNATSYDHPDMTNVLATSMKIAGTNINTTAGLFYIKPTTPLFQCKDFKNTG